MGNADSVLSGCSSNANQGQNGNPPQCSLNFDCSPAGGKVCVQYTADPGTLINSNCASSSISGCATSPSDPSYPNNVWAYSTTSSGNAVCAAIDTSKCFAAGGVPAGVCAGFIGGNFPNFSQIPSTFGPQTISPYVTCQWDLANFTTLAAVQKFASEFNFAGVCPADPNGTPCPAGGITNVFNEIIMPFFCSQTDTNPTSGTAVCPTISNAGAWVGNQCSRFVSTSAEGNYCRTWLSSIGSDKIAQNNVNTAFNDYCNTLINSSDPALKRGEINECLCLNRSKGEASGLFNQTTAALAGLPNGGSQSLGQVGCWYSPCSGGAVNQIIPLAGVNPAIDAVYYPKDCPDVCQIIIDNRGKIIGNINNTVNCGFTGGTGPTGSTGPSPPGPTGQPGPTGGNGGDTPQSFWDKYKWWILALSVTVIIIIFIIFFGVFEYKKHHTGVT